MKERIVESIATVVAILAIFQGLIPTMPFSDPAMVIIVSATTMYLVTALAAWKQVLLIKADKAAMRNIILLAVVATIGGLNEVVGVVPITDTAGQWIRFGITFTTLVVSKVFVKGEGNDEDQPSEEEEIPLATQ